MVNAQSTPELLAPAGDMTCLHAAVSAGADAVYLGLEEFNARRNAGNFSIDDLAEACEYAHLRGVSIYVTMNVELLPGEMPRAINLVREAYGAGADAFIVQDIGLATELKRLFPQVRLHASTQMNIHSAAGVEAAARLGTRRVTLARELSLTEIAHLVEVASAFGMEVETFAHGALCVCYSGQCLMSSMIGGRSANRGLCAQACRLPYELRKDDDSDALPSPGDHLLSPRDLCSIDLIGQLMQAGVSSLKVEGRMKSADYVHEVVAVYREVLDALGSSCDLTQAHASDEQRARLAEAFSRGFTTAYLEGERGNDIMSYGRPNNRGVFVGRVANVSDGEAHVMSEVALHEGDVLEFWTNRGHFAATVGCTVPSENGTVQVAIDQKVGKGDRVFRVRNAATAFNDDVGKPRVPVEGEVTLRLGEPAHICFKTYGKDGRTFIGEAYGDVVEPARTRAISRQDVCDHVDRLGQTPFTLVGESGQNLVVHMDEGIGMGFSQLHHIRADALEALKEQLVGRFDVNRTPLGEVKVRERARTGRRRESARACEVVAWVTNPSCARAARKAGASAMYVPALNFRRGQAVLAGVRQDDPDQAGYPKQCSIALPTVDHDPVPGVREYDLPFDIWDYVRPGKRVYVDSVASAIRAIECGAEVEVGPHVVATNVAALEYLADLGVKRAWLSPELTLGQIDDLAQSSPISLGVNVIGYQELMICEHCLLMSQGPCAEQCATCPRRSVAHRLVDRKGFEFPVVTDMLGRSHLFNGILTDIAQNVCDLVDIGVQAIMVDTTLMDKKASAEAVGRAVRACDLALSEHRAIGKRPNTTTGHLFRGVS